MYRVVIVAGHGVHVRQAAEILSREKELDVSPVAIIVGLARDLALLAPQELAQTAVVLFIPATPSDHRFRWDAGDAGHPPLVVYDVARHVDVLPALRMGAQGYVGFEEPEALAERVLRVAKGEFALPTGEEDACQQYVREMRCSDPRLATVTPQEIEMLQMWAKDCPIKQIATELGIAERTVTNHFQSICTQLKVKHKAQALLFLHEAGLVHFE